MNGQVYFYNYEGLKYLTQMNCRNRRGKFKKGTKVTGLTFLKIDNESANATHSYTFNTLPPLLVTTNDNRLRLFSLSDFSLRMKYKGLKNTHMQIKANFSDDGKHIICGSEIGGIVVWETQPKIVNSTLSFLFAEEGDRNCCCESIMNNSLKSVPVSTPSPTSPTNIEIKINKSQSTGLGLGMISKRYKKKIQGGIQSLLKRTRSSNLYVSTGFTTPECVSATTAAVFAPVSAIIHSARSGHTEDSPSSVSANSNVPSDSSETYARISPELLKKTKAARQGTGQGQGQGQGQGSGQGMSPRGIDVVDMNNTTDHIPSYTPSTPLPGNKATLSATTTATATAIPTTTLSPPSDDVKKDIDMSNNNLLIDTNGHADTDGLRENNSKYSNSPSPSRLTDEVENLLLPSVQGPSSSPLSDLSSRVIVATDTQGYIRVFVRTGKQVGDSKKNILGLKQMML